MSGSVYVSVFTNFEGSLVGSQQEQAESAVQWFRECAAAHPQIVWTHLYSPSYLLVEDDIDAVFTPYLVEVMAEGAEIGIHAHLFFEMVAKAGVSPILCPDGENADCSSAGNRGYGVFLTGYGRDEQARIVQASIDGLTFNGFPPPKTFCAGYSATDPTVQALLADSGFSASFAAQPMPPPTHPASYPACWHNQLEWSGHISPLTLPYRVNSRTILPPPHAEDDYLDLVEVPLNLWVDEFPLVLDGQEIAREDVFDRHLDWAVRNNDSTAVAIGVHAEVVAQESFADGRVAAVVQRLLARVEARRANSEAEIIYATAAQIAEVFVVNTTTGQVD